MDRKREVRPSLACRCLMSIAERLAPRRDRQQWQAHWESGLLAGCVLEERGEMPRDAQALLTGYTRAAFSDALWLRFSRQALLGFVRGPVFLLLACACLAVLLGALSGGFAATRHLLDLARNYRPPVPLARYDSVSDALVGNFLPVFVAFGIAAALAVIERIPMRPYRWRYRGLLAAKVLAAALLLPLAWIEGGSALRNSIAHEGLRVLVGGLGFAIALFGATGWTMHWILADQRSRCPVCLERLAFPVTIGSWASMFEPVSTEMLCQQGHGTLSVPEADIGEPDHWQELDESWHDLLTTSAAPRERG